MKDILLIGSGGREAAIAWKLRKDGDVGTIYALPGNGGLSETCTNVPIGATDLEAIIKFARTHKVDFAIVTPDNPLVMGLVDRLEAVGIPCFGPSGTAAMLEGSKAFAKNFMKRWDIPTASYEIFSDEGQALDFLASCSYPVVLKANGLAFGKGVSIVQDKDAATMCIKEMMENLKFGQSGQTVVIEELLEGPEVSLLCFTDGTHIKEMVTSMDHKRIGDGDTGPNTGGMGCIAPNPFYTPQIARTCREKILLPTITGMQKEGRSFKGCLYVGLMLTKDGPKVIEYNCRFGDPETQVILPLLESKLLPIMEATRNGTLDRVPIIFSTNRSAACLVLANNGYPISFEKHKEINIPKMKSVVFPSGICKEEGHCYTDGGRVLGLAATALTLKEALQQVYGDAEKISFEGKYYRRDIGQKALEKLGEN
ncbi:MAG: phosphoribosylamine--glycine ligase [Spirochaetia bacterium]|jgi:phosphoribosylamine--glycine ligase|nr:phosphoribosylamine--glycine ligase [Spirochaetia bacterium]